MYNAGVVVVNSEVVGLAPVCIASLITCVQVVCILGIKMCHVLRPGLLDGFFKPKIQIWVNFGGSCTGRCWYILCMDTWSILRPFVILYGHLI
jgi:hypothetical protein